MARPKIVRAPTTASLPNNLRIPSSTPSLSKSLGRLSRQALLDLAFQWLDDRCVASFPPYLQHDDEGGPDDDEALPYPAAETIEEVRQEYVDLQDRKGGKREVLDRILEGDWRHGITLRQLAMADLRYMDDHPASLRWTALELSGIGTKLKKPEEASPNDWSGSVPRMQAATFVQTLQREISPLVKAHYHLARSGTLPLTILRIFVVDSPYQSPRQAAEIFTDSSRVIYVAFPDSCPFVYTSIAASTGSKATPTATSVSTDTRTLQRLVRDAIPKALSRPQERFTLKATSLAAKNLPTLLALRGPNRSTSANGAFSIFADAVIEGSPLDPRPSNTVTPEEHLQTSHLSTTEEVIKTEYGVVVEIPSAKRKSTGNETAPLSPTSKKRRLVIHSRFGTAGSSLAPAPLDRLDIRLLDKPGADNEEEAEAEDSSTSTLPGVSLNFAGSDVITGIRKLAELGIINPERMPSWMTGEEGISVATVRQGRRLERGD
jgi:central kinetochore subunit Mis15/CHL4